MYSVPLLQSSAVKFSRGGSNVTDTFCSVCRSTGGIDAKESGVDAVIVLCSSGDMNVGNSLISVAAIEDYFGLLWHVRSTRRLLVVLMFSTPSSCAQQGLYGL